MIRINLYKEIGGSLFNDVLKLANTHLNLDGVTQDTLDIAELVMDDTLGSDNVVFEDQDLLAILKIRISALLDMKNEDGVQLFKDDKCLNNVLDKLTEAQMWLDLWTKLN